MNNKFTHGLCLSLKCNNIQNEILNMLSIIQKFKTGISNPTKLKWETMVRVIDWITSHPSYAEALIFNVTVFEDKIKWGPKKPNSHMTGDLIRKWKDIQETSLSMYSQGKDYVSTQWKDSKSISQEE